MGPNAPGGRDRFGVFLNGFTGWEGFYQLEHIVIASDNDEDPNVSFDHVRAQIANSKPKATPPVVYGVPNQPLKREPGSPSTVSVIMLPWTGKKGNLELLCLKAASNAAQPIAVCVDQFALCTGVDAWSGTKQAKMKLNSILASQNKNNPMIGLGNVWRDNKALIPLTDPCFDRIADFLQGF